jgi:SAM-dependent methyltransferase
VPTPHEVVDDMLRLANVRKGDILYDLGSGDGRIAIAAAKKYGIRAVGIDIDPDRIREANENAKKAGVTHLVKFRQEDLFKADFSEATVVTLYLLPDLNVKLRPRLLAELKPGTRIVANTFAIGDWNADQTSIATTDCDRWCTARLWIVPAKVAGRWRLSQGELVLKQTYQSFSGSLSEAGNASAVRGRLRGAEIFFGAKETRFTGRVDGNVIEGIARTAGIDSNFRATRIGN